MQFLFPAAPGMPLRKTASSLDTDVRCKRRKKARQRLSRGILDNWGDQAAKQLMAEVIGDSGAETGSLDEAVTAKYADFRRTATI
jgi:hypothetical protein